MEVGLNQCQSLWWDLIFWFLPDFWSKFGRSCWWIGARSWSYWIRHWIGLVWARINHWLENKVFAKSSPLKSAQGAAFWSLHRGAQLESWRRLPGLDPFCDLYQLCFRRFKSLDLSAESMKIPWLNLLDSCWIFELPQYSLCFFALLMTMMRSSLCRNGGPSFLQV